MIIDTIDRLPLYRNLVASVSSLDGLRYSYAADMDGFDVDERMCTLFIPQDGSASVATGWREADASNDVTGVVRIGEGRFALFLPGERFVVRCDGRCRRYALE